MITTEIIEELKESNAKMQNILERLERASPTDITKLRCELLKTLELLPAQSHEVRNNECC